MINDATLSADGLSPLWRLTDGAGNSLSGYGWSSSSIYGVGGGTLKYNVTYTPPAGVYQWTLEVAESVTGGVPSGLTSAPVNLASGAILAAMIATLATMIETLAAIEAQTNLIGLPPLTIDASSPVELIVTGGA